LYDECDPLELLVLIIDAFNDMPRLPKLVDSLIDDECDDLELLVDAFNNISIDNTL